VSSPAPAPAGRILLVGCGKMGRALGTGWLARGLPPNNLLAVEPDNSNATAANAEGIAVVARPEDLYPDFTPDWTVLAVKPQVLAAAAAYAQFSATSHYLSIVAGKTLTELTALLGQDARVVRAMPNTPVAVGRGITATVAGEGVLPAAREKCTALLAAVGDVVWLDEETMMDAVTAVSGSGPAYVFLLIECLSEAGRQAGLPTGLAGRLALATVAGAGELARLSEEDAATLRQNVTSPAGTTEAALEVLMDMKVGFQPLLTSAIAAAARRSKELASIATPVHRELD